MAKAIWSTQATREFKDFISYLKQHNQRSAVEAATEIKSMARFLARRPLLGRQGRREGEREFSVTHWHKVFVYRVTSGGIDISTLRDPRMQPRPDDTDT